jgi:N6-adenosine-specific RNA methylase IME4
MNQLKLPFFKPIQQQTIPYTHKYHVIYCDPPWDYDGRTFLNKKANDTGAASDHYPTMTPQELIDFGSKIKTITTNKAICYMWTTGPQLDISIDVLKAWGFTYKTIAFVWDKQRTNPGHYTLSQTEICIVGTQKAIPKPRGIRNAKQFHSIPRSNKHSEKPTIFRDIIHQMHPLQNKIEIFARNNDKNWDVWGYDAPNPVALPF